MAKVKIKKKKVTFKKKSNKCPTCGRARQVVYMTNEQLKLIFSIPEKDLLQFLLNKVNLTEKELKVINNCLVKGYTEEYTAEIMEMSRNRSTEYKEKSIQ